MLTGLTSVLGLSFVELASQNPTLASELDAALKAHAQEIRDELMNAPLGTVPLVLAIVDAARLDEVLALVPLTAVAQRELRGYARPEALEPDVLQGLVDKGVIAPGEADAVGQMLERYLCCDDDVGLVGSIGKAGGKVTNPQLAEWSPAHWLVALVAVDARPRSGISLASFAQIVTRRLEVLYPVSSWIGRMAPFDAAATEADLDTLAVLEPRNPHRFAGAFASLRLDDVKSSELERVEEAWNRLVVLVRGYPGLGLASAFEHDGQKTAERAGEAKARIGALRSAITAAGGSPRTDLLALDLSNGSPAWDRWKLSSIGPALRAQVVACVRAFQRMRVIAGDLDTASAVMRAGYSSGSQITRTPLATFVATIAISDTLGQRVWETARRLATDAALYVAAVSDQLGGASDPLPTRPPPSVGQSFAALDGYASLFGSQAFCDCAHCASILGPAAYFVDLMEFVKQEVGAQIPTAHRLALAARRPDLWTTPLTCAATNELVPTLTIVNEVLENDVARRAGYTGPWDDRETIEALVYQTALPALTRSFAQPFAVGLARTSAAIAAAGVSWPVLAEATGATGGSYRRVALGLSTVWEQLLVTPRLTLLALSEVYGMTFSGTSQAVDHVDATALAAAMGVDRATLGAVVTSWFVGRGGATPRIVAGRRGPDSVQNDLEWVEELTADALDRMHRLSRAAAALGITAAAADRRLRAASDESIDVPSIERFAAVASLASGIGAAFTEDDAVALGGVADQPIFDRRFNRGVRAGVDVWPNPDARLWHPGLVPPSLPFADGAAARLAAGLGLTDGVTLALTRVVAPLLTREGGFPFDPAATNVGERYFMLSAANLAVLDRYVRLMRLLGIGVDDLVQLASVAGLGWDLTAGGALAVMRARDAWRAGGRTMDQLAVAAGLAPRRAVAGFDPAATVAAIRDGAVAALAIEDTFFAAALGLSTAASLDVITANAAWFETVDDQRVIAPGIDVAIAPIVVPPSAILPDGRTLTIDELRVALIMRSARTRVTRALATATQRSDAEIVALYGLARQHVTAAVASDVLVANPAAPLASLVTAIERMAVATRGWSVDGIALLTAEPARFGSGEWPALTPTFEHPTAPWFSFEQATQLGRAAPRAERPDLQAAIVAVIAAFDPVSDDFASSADAALASLLGADEAIVASLHGSFPLSRGAIGAIGRVASLTALCRTLGIDGRVLSSNVSDLDPDRVRGAVAIDRAAAARGESQPSTATLLEQVRQRVREQCRDALVDHLLRALPTPEFRDVVALANHFLIDVVAGGCATTSRVVAATNAVQAYITRITLGLERDDLPPTDPDHVGVVLSDAGRASWEWRRAYRVWEANRKVFLWPENYLDPSIRDDKTPLFAQLEDALAQGALDEASILGAYAAYLHELDELASLRIAGAYHDIGVDPDGAAKDVLHLIGVTDADPMVFYYRSVTDLITSAQRLDRGVVWSAWHKLDLPIASRVVSPVVHQGRMHLLWGTIRTRAKQSLVSGDMAFTGYQHALTLSMVTQRPTGQWGAAQDVAIPMPVYRHLFHPTPGLVPDPRGGDGRVFYEPSGSAHDEPREAYTLVGAPWLGVWPTVDGDVLQVRYRGFAAEGDLDPYARSLTGAESYLPRPSRSFIGVDDVRITGGTPTSQFLPPTALGNLLVDKANLVLYAREWDAATASVVLNHAQPVYQRLLATAHRRPQSLAITGSISDAIVRIGGDLIHLRSPVVHHTRHVARRLGTTVTRGLGRVLFERGLDGLLATAHQLALAEAPLPMTIEADRITDRSDAGTVNFRGAFGVYLRELFFHIPLLVATNLAARGRYADARRWFHRVFDPTSTEVIDTTGVPPGEAAHRSLDRVWRYRELRGLTPERAREILTDGAALAAYREDPFNPHAIARRRLTAYQRYAFARYVDNLLDWGDSLFAQFTRETVEEARLLYQLASELLGVRPARLGDCDPGAATPLNYRHIEPLLGQAGEVSEAAESEIVGGRVDPAAEGDVGGFVASARRLTFALEQFPLRPLPSSTPVSLARQWLAGRIGAWAPAKGVGTSDGPLGLGGQVGAPARGYVESDSLAASLLAQLGPVFCVPVNKTLLARWDRVEDRLWKIRHCMDLDGNRRELALFAPELDPMSRVTATALGLTPEDLVPDLARDVPPYRFGYLIERAKGFASALASFGGALLNALERRDNEVLSRLRQEQGLAMARATRRQRELDLDASRESLAGVDVQIVAAEHRREYYDELLTTGRDAFEATEIASRSLALRARGLALASHLSASIAKLLPEFNAPWTVSYGGQEVGGAAEAGGLAYNETASLLEAGGSLAGLIGSQSRRARDWKQSSVAVRDDLAALARQRQVGALRVRSAEHALVLHDESVAQLGEAFAFERDRITNLAFHTRLADGLKRLHRLAYGHALALARLAERAYRYERGDDAGGLDGGYWDASLGGLLSGERLLSDLHALDRRFLESNHRELEIDQPIPLSQIDPAALLTLRETGSCEFQIPEAAFDLAYPGHWRRRLRAVRLTIPCVTGPYVNVSATLTMLDSQVRTAPAAALAPVPLAHAGTIATSSAQADGGVFELSFRDERYLPFEGQGAVSSWRLELPRTVRGFDYASITDVIVSMAYSARPDAARRALVEGPASVPGSLLRHYQDEATLRIVSARQGLEASFTRLLRTAPGTPVSFELSADLLPSIFRRRQIEILSPATAGMPAGVALRLASGVAPGGFALTVDGLGVGDFHAEPGLGGLWFAEVPWPITMTWTGTHTLAVSAVGGLGGGGALDPDKLLDVMLVLPIRLSSNV